MCVVVTAILGVKFSETVVVVDRKRLVKAELRDLVCAAMSVTCGNQRLGLSYF